MTIQGISLIVIILARINALKVERNIFH